MFNTNRNNLSDLVEWREGRRYDGMIGTADNLSTKFGEALAAKLLTGALAAAGYDAELTVQPDSAIHAINAMMGWVPAIFGVCIMITVLFLNIDQDLEKCMRKRVNNRLIVPHSLTNFLPYQGFLLNRSANQSNDSMKQGVAMAAPCFFVVVLSIECDEILSTLPNLVFGLKYPTAFIYFEEILWLNRIIHVDVCPTI